MIVPAQILRPRVEEGALDRASDILENEVLQNIADPFECSVVLGIWIHRSVYEIILAIPVNLVHRCHPRTRSIVRVRHEGMDPNYLDRIGKRPIFLHRWHNLGPPVHRDDHALPVTALSIACVTSMPICAAAFS